MNSKCLILYNNHLREYEYLLKIKNILINDFGVETIIHKRYPSSVLLKKAFMFRPNVILTYPLTSRGLSTELYILKFLFKCKIIALRTEGVFNYENPMNLLRAAGQDIYGDNLIDFEVFWGPKSAKIIGKMLYDNNKISSLDRIKYFGYPKWEIHNFIDDILLNLNRDIKKNLYEETLLFVTGFQVSSYDNKEKILYAKDIPIDDVSGVIKAAKLAKSFRKKLVQTINKAAKINPTTFYIIKIHPLESQDDYNFVGNNIKVVHNTHKVSDLLMISDYFFHYGSTTAAEAFKLNKPVFYYYDVPLNEYFVDLKWPSNKKIIINNLQHFLTNKEFKNTSPISLSKSKEVLKDHFNYIEGEDYKPSFSIAKLISDNMDIQTISFNDKYFLKSVISIISKSLNIFKWKF
ncbi:MAG: hypothetical protein VW741_03835 [Flammeovirgaceae bacterium]